jgi:hypothetical protein
MSEFYKKEADLKEPLHNYISGVVLQPNQVIHGGGGSYILSEEAVKRIMYKSMEQFKDKVLPFDTNHDNVELEGITLVESYINPIERSGWPKGAWIITVKVESDELLEKLKDKKINAFSVQIQFGYNEVLKEVAQRLPIITATKFENDHCHVVMASVKDGQLYVEVLKAEDGHTHNYLPTESITQEENGHKHRIDRILG